MLAAKPRPRGAACRCAQQVTVGSYERPPPLASPTDRALANAFILGLLGAAAFLVVAAMVQKRSRRRRNVAGRRTNHAA